MKRPSPRYILLLAPFSCYAGRPEYNDNKKRETRRVEVLDDLGPRSRPKSLDLVLIALGYSAFRQSLFVVPVV